MPGKFTISFLTIAAAGVLAGCNAPAVQRDAEIARFRAAMTQRSAALDLKPGEVLSMKRCEEIALANNLSLGVSRLTLRLQDDNVRLALASGLPTASVQYNYVTRNKPNMIMQNGMTFKADDRHLQTAGLGVTVPVIDFGVTYLAWHNARDRQAQERLVLDRSVQQLRRDVRIAYAEHASAHRQVVLAATNVKAAEEVLRVAESLQREGLSTSAETAVVRATVAEARVELANAGQRIDETRLTLSQLMSLPPGVALRIDDRLPELPAPPRQDELARHEDHALRVRPELRVQDLGRHISANTVRQQVAGLMPRLDLNAAFNWTSSSFVVNPAFLTGGFTVANSLLQGGTQVWRLNQANITMDIEKERSLLLALGVLYDVDLRAIQLYRQRDTIAALEVQEKARREAFDRILSLYREGLENEASTARALAELSLQSLSLDKAKTDYLATWYEYEAAVLPDEHLPTASGPATTTASGSAPAPAAPTSAAATATSPATQPVERK